MSKADLYTIQEAMEVLGGISRGTVYKLMREGVLASVLIGRRRFVPCRAIDNFIASATTTQSPSLKSSRRGSQPQLQLIVPRSPRR